MLPVLLVAFAASAEPEYRSLTLTVDGTKREALVYYPPKASKPAPLVFCWHGHGGTMRYSTKAYPFAALMPDAVSVYPQGLPTAGITDPEGKKPGWQQKPGQLADRDLKYFDALLAQLKKDTAIDDKRIYSLGHSNGGQITYVLWTARPDVFAAIAPSACGLAGIRKNKPIPLLHVIGREDQIVSSKYQEIIIAAVKEVNKVETAGKDWAKDGPVTATLFSAKAGGADTVIAAHPGDHKYPTEVPKMIAKFFAEHVKP
jgi:polyhydroxybutyrate depolymerase